MTIKSSTLTALFFLVCSITTSTHCTTENTKQGLEREISSKEEHLYKKYEQWYSNEKRLSKKQERRLINRSRLLQIELNEFNLFMCNKHLTNALIEIIATALPMIALDNGLERNKLNQTVSKFLSGNLLNDITVYQQRLLLKHFVLGIITGLLTKKIYERQKKKKSKTPSFQNYFEALSLNNDKDGEENSLKKDDSSNSDIQSSDSPDNCEDCIGVLNAIASEAEDSDDNEGDDSSDKPEDGYEDDYYLAEASYQYYSQPADNRSDDNDLNGGWINDQKDSRRPQGSTRKRK